jgi:acyl carrier protein
METDSMLASRITEVLEKALSKPGTPVTITPESVGPNTDLWTKFELDSLDVVDFSMRLEEAFAIKIPEEDLDLFRTVHAIVEYVRGKTASYR